MKFLLAAMLLFCCVQWDASAEEMRSVTQEESAQHLLKNVDPVYPAMGKQLHIQGEVKLRIAISDTGSVRLLEIVSGSPLLVSAAVEAVQQRRYSPFVVDGHAVAVQTTVTVPFSLGDTAEKIQELNNKNDLFFKTMDLCRKQIRAKELSEAENTCRQTITLSAELDPSRQLERMEAVQQTGHALFLQRRFPEALQQYETELQIGTKALKPYQAELAAAQYDVGNGLWGTGRLEEARLEYEKAESTYRQAAQHIESAFLENEYAKRLKRILALHADLLRQMNRFTEADTLDKEAAAIVIKEGRKEN